MAEIQATKNILHLSSNCDLSAELKAELCNAYFVYDHQLLFFSQKSHHQNAVNRDEYDAYCMTE